MRRRWLGVSTIVYLIVLGCLINFFLMPSQGVGDGIGGWPVGQSVDSTIDTAPSSSSTPESQTEESDMNYLTLLWEFTLALL